MPGEEADGGGGAPADRAVSEVVPWGGAGSLSPWDRIVSVGEMGTVLQRVPYSVLYPNTSRATELQGEHLRVGRLRATWRCRTPLDEVAAAMEDLVSLQSLAVAETQGYKEAGVGETVAADGNVAEDGGAGDGDLFGGKRDDAGGQGTVAKDETPGDPIPLLDGELDAGGFDDGGRGGQQLRAAQRPPPFGAAPDSGAGDGEEVADEEEEEEADGEEEEDPAGGDARADEGDEEGSGRWDPGGAASALLSSLGLGGRRLFQAAAEPPGQQPAAPRRRVRYPAALPRQHAIVATGSLSLELASITGTPLHVGCGLVAPLPSAPLPRLGPGFAPGTTGHAFMVSMWVRTTSPTIETDACPAVLCGAAINAGRPGQFCQVLLSQRAAVPTAADAGGDGASPAAAVRPPQPPTGLGAERGAIPLSGEMRKRSFRLSASKGLLSFMHPFPTQPQGLSAQTRLVKRGWRVSTKLPGSYATGSWRHVALVYNGALTVTCDEEAPPPVASGAAAEAMQEGTSGDASGAGLPGAAAAMQARANGGASGPECSLPRYTYAHKWSLFLDALLEETAGQSGTVVAPADLADGGTLLPRYLTLAAGFGDTHDLQVSVTRGRGGVRLALIRTDSPRRLLPAPCLQLDAVAVYGPGLFTQDDVAAARNAGLQHRRERIDAALCDGAAG